MNRNRYADTAATLILLLSMQLPALAEDAAQPSVAASTSTSSPNAPAAQGANVPKKILGVMTGVVVGTPVCAVKRMVEEEKHAVGDMCGYNQKKRLVLPAVVLWAPFCAISGTLQAPFWALNNSLANHDKPFSKEQFSLTDQD